MMTRFGRAFGMVSVIFTWMIPSAFAAPPLPADTAAKSAEMLYFSIQGHTNLSQWVSSLKLTPARREEIQSYLKAKKITDAPLPQVEWEPGSPVLVFKNRVHSYPVDFTLLPGNHSVTIHNKAISVDKNTRFSDLVDEINRVMMVTTGQLHASRGLWDLLEPAAEANPVLAVAVAAGVAIGAGVFALLDGITACMGWEDVTHIPCFFRSNAAMIQADIGPDEVLTKFKCEGKALKKVETRGSGVDLWIDFRYDSKGVLSEIDFSQDGDLKCRYTTAPDGKHLLSIESKTTVADYCERPDSVSAVKSATAGGTLPRMIATSDFPVWRGMDCCQSDSCKSEMKVLVEHSTGEPPGPGGAAAGGAY